MHHRFISAISLASLLTACTSAVPPTPGASTSHPTGRTIILGAPGPTAQRLSSHALIERTSLTAQMLSDVQYDDGSLSVPIDTPDPGSQQLLYAQPGDHIISAPTAQAPDGFVVEVTNTYQSGNNVVLATEESSLEESVSDLDLDEDYDMPVQSLQSLTFADGSTYTLKASDFLPAGVVAQNLHPESTFTIPGINKAFSQVVGSCGDGKIGLTGSLGNNLKGFLNVKIGFFTLKKVEAGVKLTQKANVTLGVECKEAFSQEFPILTLNYGTYIIWAGPIPIVVRPKVEIVAGASGQVSAQVSFQVDSNSAGTLGLGWYKGEGFKSINTTSSTFTQTLKVGGSGKIRGWVGAKAGFSFYGGVAYAYGYPKAFVEGTINADIPSNTFNYCLDAGLGLSAGGYLKVFGKTLGKKEFDLGETRQHLACGSTGGGTVTPPPVEPPVTPPVTPPPPRPIPCGTGEWGNLSSQVLNPARCAIP